jgi:hypothetical protein
MQKHRSKYCLGFCLALVVIGVLMWCGIRSQAKISLSTVDLGDGRILQIEGVSYGSSHRVGNARSELIGRFQPWLPRKLMGLLEPKYPQSTIDHLDRPALVVWVNAINPTTRLNVDCQGIRVELMSEQGDLFPSETSSWFGGSHFWRVGHVFYAFPRSERSLTMLVTTWKNNQTRRVEFSNPYVAQPAVWLGDALPKQKEFGAFSIVLAQLKLTTDGSAQIKYWETKSVYWEPVWELRRGEKKVDGWDAPTWIAEDPMGNKSQQLGVHQPILRFSAAFYPSPTNTEAAQLIATLPEVVLTNPQPILRWSQKIHFGTNEISVLGFFPAGNYVFSDGILLTNPAVTMGAVRGGAPSGWTGQSMMVSPIKKKYYHGHYSTANSIIYLRAPALGAKARLAVRLRDERGACWTTELEPQGTPDGIHAYLVNLPPETRRVVPELVVLKPVEAEFTVKVPDMGNP